MPTALICGVTGQDGAYLARFLLSIGYEVWGTSRDATSSEFANLKRLGIFDQVKKISMSTNDFRSVLNGIVSSAPSEIYNLSGQSSVGLSFEQPVETLESIATGTLNLLEAIRFLQLPVRFYNAGSGECFGDTGLVPANESTSFSPRSPYAVAKCTAHWLVSNYRQAYGLHAATGILFNHESPLRPARFVTRKIVQSALRISGGDTTPLALGNLSIRRDWGWSEDYVEAMWKMLQLDNPRDFVIATGVATPLQEFVAEAFSQVGLNWRNHVVVDPSLLRGSDIEYSCGDSAAALHALNWRANVRMPEIVGLMLQALRTN